MTALPNLVEYFSDSAKRARDAAHLRQLGIAQDGDGSGIECRQRDAGPQGCGQADRSADSDRCSPRANNLALVNRAILDRARPAANDNSEGT